MSYYKMGRPTKEESILRKMIPKKESSNKPMFDNFVIPNQSGQHDAGLILNTPILDTDIVNKKYVDSLIPSLPLSHIDAGEITDVGTNTHAQIDTHIADTTNPHDVSLSELTNMEADKTYNCSDNSISFNFTNPSGQPTYDGAFEIQANGAFTGDLFHVHQHTGNPGTTDLVHFEAEDADVCVLRLEGNAACSILGIGAVGSEVLTLDASGNLLTAGTISGSNIYTGEFLYHEGDADTNFQFENNKITWNAGGREFMSCIVSIGNELSINNNGELLNLRVKGQNDINLIHTVAGTDRVGIGTAAPDEKLTVAGNISGSQHVHATGAFTGTFLDRGGQTVTVSGGSVLSVV